MCPDPFNMTVDFVFIMIAIPLIQYPVALGVWLYIGVLCFFYAPRHSVFCGIPMVHPSRFEVLMDEIKQAGAP